MEQGALIPDSPYIPLYPSSEPLYNGIGSIDLYLYRTRSEAIISSSARFRSLPLYYTRTLPETQLSKEGYLYTGQGIADEYKLINRMLDTLFINKGAREQQEVKQEKDKDNNKDISSKSKYSPSL
jgi:hypothetical protein